MQEVNNSNALNTSTLMKRLFILATSLTFLFTACGNAHRNKPMEHFELTPETAHPNAKALMKEEFYWSPIEETAPFGSDDGSDAFYGFREWRLSNPATSPVTFLIELIKGWQYPPFDLNEMDTAKINQYLSAKTKMEENTPAMMEHFKSMKDSTGKQMDEAQIRELLEFTSGSMGSTFLVGQDNAIIAVGFGQFVLEGKIDEDIKALTKTAINRELLPVLIDRWGDDYKKTRQELLTKMLVVVDLMNE